MFYVLTFSPPQRIAHPKVYMSEPVMLTVFKSHASVMGYCFKSGKVIHFMNGMYATSSKSEIEELTAECENGHPNYYIDAEQKTINAEHLDPMAALRAQIREEEKAKLLVAVGNPLRDMGETKQGKLEGIANSHSINGLQAASEAQALAAQTVISASGAVNKPIVLANKAK